MKQLTMNKVTALIAAAGATLAFTACLGGTDAPDEQLEPEDVLEDTDKEPWDSANNPTRVDSTFLILVHQLPVSGEVETAPWPGDYWATARDSLNHKWDSSGSPSEKWAAAFGRPQTVEQVSRTTGVKSASWRKACETNSDCTDLKDGSSCVASYDGAMKRCIPGWWGICHGWAPAATKELAPTKAVTVPKADGSGDVTFYPGDLEGLMSLMYTEVPTKFLSSRCNKDNPTTDASGRLVDGECRDMNPGAWHVLTTNMIGLRKQAFVLDRTYDDEVWNQPMSSFKITNAVDDKLPELTKAQAAAKLGLTVASTALIATSDVAKSAWSRKSFAPAAGTYTVRMTGDGDADLYVKKGSEPTESDYDCRPYAGTSNEECEITVAAGETVHVGVLGYATTSKISVSYTKPDASGNYVYNTAATRFFEVKQEYCYIVESSPGRTSHNPSNFTTCDDVAYILEADDNGKILGGEWLGSSRTNHPDFAWYATGAPSSSQANGLIKYSEVKALFAKAIDVVDNVIDFVMLTNHDMKATSAWKSKYVAISVEAGAKSLAVKMTGTGDAQLFVRRNQNPTVYTYDCKSDAVGSSNETCTLTDPAAGVYYVRIRTRTANTVVSVNAIVTR